MPITNEEGWQRCQDTNLDPYGQCIVDVAREVMRLLDEQENFDPGNIVLEAAAKIWPEGITNAMAGCVATVIKLCHSRGAEFEEKWNKPREAKEPTP